MELQRGNRAVRVLAPVLFGVTVVLALISLVAGWPQQFGGSGSKANILADFVSSGTATAPPLFALVIFGVAAFVAGRRDRWGTAALIVLLLLAVLMAVGSLGEGLAAPSPDVPRPVQFLSGGFGALAGFALFVAAGLALWERSRQRTAQEERASVGS